MKVLFKFLKSKMGGIEIRIASVDSIHQYKANHTKVDMFWSKLCEKLSTTVQKVGVQCTCLTDFFFFFILPPMNWIYGSKDSSLGVSIHWTGLLDWNTGLDYWTDILNHKNQFSSIN